MLIFDHEPADWAELQDRVAQLFSELGCDVKVCETVKLVRGEKEIDVTVRDPQTTRLLCISASASSGARVYLKKSFTPSEQCFPTSERTVDSSSPGRGFSPVPKRR
jgi:hypothetical protein